MKIESTKVRKIIIRIAGINRKLILARLLATGHRQPEYKELKLVHSYWDPGTGNPELF
jgi:hypothetical protein